MMEPMKLGMVFTTRSTKMYSWSMVLMGFLSWLVCFSGCR